MTAPLYEMGMVGLGVMGRSLALNMADHGYSVVGYDKNPAAGRQLIDEGEGKPVAFAATPAEFTAMIRPPRAVMLLVAPAHVVDFVLRDLLPHLSTGDLVIDAGNSYFRDTDRRAKTAEEKGVRFFGMGVSGGEAGARYGPSLMPGGPRDAYERVRPVLEAVAARVQGEPCVAYLGPGSCGHYVKTVHNGIEYGVMQLIAEVYDLLRRGPGLSNDELADVFARWGRGPQGSYLLEITAQIFRRDDEKTGKRLVDLVRDAAGQKGTGKWTSQEALELGVPTPTIDAAVSLRVTSGRVTERSAGRKLLPGADAAFAGDRQTFLDRLGDALYAASAVTYAQGMDLLAHASKTYGYGLSLDEVARVWRGGCIIRAGLLDDVRAAYRARPDLPNLLLDPGLSGKLAAGQAGLRAAVRAAAELGLPAPALSASLAYYDALRCGPLPTNLVQAQRDFFGAHTYERTDEPPGTAHHTRWDSPGASP